MNAEAWMMFEGIEASILAVCRKVSNGKNLHFFYLRRPEDQCFLRRLHNNHGDEVEFGLILQ